MEQQELMDDDQSPDSVPKFQNYMGAIHNEENNITHGSPSMSREIQ